MALKFLICCIKWKYNATAGLSFYSFSLSEISRYIRPITRMSHTSTRKGFTLLRPTLRDDVGPISSKVDD